MIVNITECQKATIERKGFMVVEIKRILSESNCYNPNSDDIYAACLFRNWINAFDNAFNDGIEALRELGKSLSETIINIAENMNRFKNKYKTIRKIGDVRHLPFVAKRIYHRCRNTC